MMESNKESHLIIEADKRLLKLNVTSYVQIVSPAASERVLRSLATSTATTTTTTATTRVSIADEKVLLLCWKCTIALDQVSIGERERERKREGEVIIV